MLMCWAHNPENRPSFGDILQVLTHLSENASSHIMLDKLPEGLKSSDIVENSGAIAWPYSAREGGEWGDKFG